ncbi:MAG: thiamine-phosphate kinase [Pseudohongiellaceae bacterium]
MSLSEFETISHYFDSPKLSFAREGITLGIGDDGAVLKPTAGPMSISMDLLVEGVHFPMDGEGFGIGYRALAVNLSDLAAMGAQPLCFTLGLTLNRVEDGWLREFSAGLSQLAQKFDCPLVGGDLTRTQPGSPTVIAIQAHGIHQNRSPVLRSTAEVGDDIYVSGTLGDGAAALVALGIKPHLDGLKGLSAQGLTDSQRENLAAAYYQPQPRVEFALAAGEYMNACIDISDGLAGDIAHILRASKVGADVLLERLPYSEPVKNLLNPQARQQAALYGGDDYELCFTAAKQHADALASLATEVNLPLTKVGEVTTGKSLRLLDSSGDIVNSVGEAYQHFN